MFFYLRYKKGYICERLQVEDSVLGCREYFSPKALVLHEFLELSEPPIHFSNAPRRLLSISDEFRGDYGVIEGDYPG